MVPITGRAGTFLEFKKIQSQSKLNPNPIQSIFCSSVSKANLSSVESCFLFFVRLHGQLEPFGSYHLLQSCFLSSSVYMAKLSRLVAALFSSLAHLSSSVSTAYPRCLLVTPSPVLVFTPTHFHHLASIFLGVARRCFPWSSLSDILFFSSCNFFGYPSCFIFFASNPQPFFPLFLAFLSSVL